MPVCQEEIFGPVAPVLTFESEDEVIGRANDTTFGLAAYFYSRDLARVMRVSERLEYGLVGVNDAAGYTHEIPFGGFKESGLGREGGRQGIEDYTEVKSRGGEHRRTDRSRHQRDALRDGGRPPGRPHRGCASEERFTRLKNDAGYPRRAIDALLAELGLTPAEIDLVALAGARAASREWLNRVLHDEAYARSTTASRGRPRAAPSRSRCGSSARSSASSTPSRGKFGISQRERLGFVTEHLGAAGSSASSASTTTPATPPPPTTARGFAGGRAARSSSPTTTRATASAPRPRPGAASR